MKLSEAIEALCLATRADGRSPQTVGAYREKLGHLRVFLGDVLIEDITTADLRRYVVSLMDQTTLYADHPTQRERARRLSPSTMASRVGHMKRLFNWLAEERILTTNPAARIKRPRIPDQEPKGIEWDDVQALLETTRGGSQIDLRDRAIICFLADTGCSARAVWVAD